MAKNNLINRKAYDSFRAAVLERAKDFASLGLRAVQIFDGTLKCVGDVYYFRDSAVVITRDLVGATRFSEIYSPTGVNPDDRRAQFREIVRSVR